MHQGMPSEAQALGPQHMDMMVKNYQAFWHVAKENAPCYLDALSFSMMKASATSAYISNIDCMLTRIPLKSKYTPSSWRNCIDIIILKGK
jgi:hypothetical protein